jgi:hypothetical protein
MSGRSGQGYKMIQIAKLIAELQKFPPTAYAYAYDAEVCGLVIVRNLNTREDLGVIIANAERVAD